MPLINFPNVPNVLGVPNVARSGLSLDEDAVLSAIYSGDILSIIDSVVTPKYGIHKKDGSNAIRPDSFISFEYRAEARVSDYPVQPGAFASYNKVVQPFDMRISMSCSGSLAAAGMTKESFLTVLDEMRISFELLDIVTPDKVYADVNLVHYDLSKTSSKGATMLVVEAYFREIRETADAEYKNVKSDSAVEPIGTCNVVPNQPTKEQEAFGLKYRIQ
jgi:hypothetical protein